MHERPSDAPRRRRAAAAALLLALSAAGLGGCAPTAAPEPTPAPTPSLTQEQQDAAIFEHLYQTYIDLPLNDETESDLSQVLTGSALSGDIQGLAADRQSQRRTEGKDTYRGFQVTDQGHDDKGSDYMVAQVCLDVSGTRIVDASGRDVTPARDANLSIQMKAVKNTAGSWRISDFVRNDGLRACD